ncbi:hypothetical protein RRF57_005787 [Xylaria bambusicola]|uniref:Uncharacterized protein n=1 Tax=Xylaria bambusicola TaxID=326684 RepID=A0AAN7UKA4_9PEZI
MASVSGPDYNISLNAIDFDSISAIQLRASSIQSNIRPEPIRQKPEVNYAVPQLSKTVEYDHVFNAIGTKFLKGSKTVLTLERTKPSDLDIHQIETSADITFIPADFPWVRLETTFRRDSLYLYIKRVDAQRMALALLSLPWHIESYLISRDESSICFRLLTSVSNNLQSLVSRVHRGIEYLSLGPNDKDDLREAMLSVLSNLSYYQIGRSLSHSLYKLDQVLEKINPGDRRISEMVGVLVLTGLEFTTLIRQFVRRLDRTANITIPVDCTMGAIKVPTAFGPVQEFIVNRNELWPNEVPKGILNETYTSILLASLRACLRSKMLRTGFDSKPLLSHVAGFQGPLYLS